MVFADHMDIYLLVCSRPPEGSIPTTADVILAMTGQRILVSSNTGSLDRSIASHQAYEAEWDNWTQIHENNSPLAAPDIPSSTIDTQATWNSNDPLPDDGAAKRGQSKCHKTLTRSLYLGLRSWQNCLQHWILARKYQLSTAHTYQHINTWY